MTALEDVRKRIGSFLMMAFCALGFALVGGIYLAQALSEMAGTDTNWRLCALISLAGSVLWLIRAVLESRRLEKPERKAAAAGATTMLVHVCAVA